MASISERATVSAASSAAAVIAPSRKKRCVMPTQPIVSDSRRSGSKPRPMMNSVDPPPMSITSRGRVDGGSSCATPKNVRRASSCPLMTSIGNPSVRSASATNSCEFFATRNTFVATTRTAGGMKSRQPLAKAGKARQRGLHRGTREPALVVDAGAEAQRLAPRVELVDLVAFDAADFEPEAVRAQVDDG